MHEAKSQRNCEEMFLLPKVFSSPLQISNSQKMSSIYVFGTHCNLLLTRQSKIKLVIAQTKWNTINKQNYFYDLNNLIRFNFYLSGPFFSHTLYTSYPKLYSRIFFKILLSSLTITKTVKFTVSTLLSILISIM